MSLCHNTYKSVFVMLLYVIAFTALELYAYAGLRPANSEEAKRSNVSENYC